MSAGIVLFSRVGGRIIHPLSEMIFVNDMAWARKGQCLDRTRMDGWMDVRDVSMIITTHGPVLNGMNE